MSESALQLLAAFELLPVKEQHELLVAMLQRSSEKDYSFVNDSSLSDVHLAVMADEVFQALDAEEANGCNPESR